MTCTVQVLDYGSGNLFSIANALKSTSAEVRVKIASSYSEGKVDGLILPGVGSFTSAQEILGKNKRRILKDVEEGKVAVLGICLGMQLLFDQSEEGKGDGLGVFSGKVIRFEKKPGVKVPHMGWNTINLSKRDSQLCDKLSNDDWVYYVHSYFPVPEDKRIVSAWTSYGGQKFASIVEKDNVFGTQFHPEKSHTVGAQLVRNYVRAITCKSRK